MNSRQSEKLARFERVQTERKNQGRSEIDGRVGGGENQNGEKHTTRKYTERNETSRQKLSTRHASLTLNVSNGHFLSG